VTVRILVGDVRERLMELADASVHAVVTSPPFWHLRDYGDGRQIGREPTREGYVAALVDAFAGVRRVLRDDGAVWLQLGDTYAAGGNGGGGSLVAKRRQWTGAHQRKGWRRQAPGFKEKDLTLAPFAVADALRADGWYLRSVVVWNKEVATEPPRLDRPSSSHEYLFLLAKSERYALRDPGEPWFRSTVWTIRPQPSFVAHPAVMPAELARRCIVCATKRGDVVLDPFAGSGTTGMVADGLQREAVLIELNEDYGAVAEERFRRAAGIFATVAAE
jgi:DNA modification methylase